MPYLFPFRWLVCGVGIVLAAIILALIYALLNISGKTAQQEEDAGIARRS